MMPAYEHVTSLGVDSPRRNGSQPSLGPSDTPQVSDSPTSPATPAPVNISRAHFSCGALSPEHTEIAVKAAAEAVAKMCPNNTEAERRRALVQIRYTRQALSEMPPFELPFGGAGSGSRPPDQSPKRMSDKWESAKHEAKEHSPMSRPWSAPPPQKDLCNNDPCAAIGFPSPCCADSTSSFAVDSTGMVATPRRSPWQDYFGVIQEDKDKITPRIGATGSPRLQSRRACSSNRAMSEEPRTQTTDPRLQAMRRACSPPPSADDSRLQAMSTACSSTNSMSLDPCARSMNRDFSPIPVTPAFPRNTSWSTPSTVAAPAFPRNASWKTLSLSSVPRLQHNVSFSQGGSLSVVPGTIPRSFSMNTASLNAVPRIGHTVQRSVSMQSVRSADVQDIMARVEQARLQANASSNQGPAIIRTMEDSMQPSCRRSPLRTGAAPTATRVPAVASPTVSSFQAPLGPAATSSSSAPLPLTSPPPAMGSPTLSSFRHTLGPAATSSSSAPLPSNSPPPAMGSPTLSSFRATLGPAATSSSSAPLPSNSAKLRSSPSIALGVRRAMSFNSPAYTPAPPNPPARAPSVQRASSAQRSSSLGPPVTSPKYANPPNDRFGVGHASSLRGPLSSFNSSNAPSSPLGVQRTNSWGSYKPDPSPRGKMKITPAMQHASVVIPFL